MVDWVLDCAGFGMVIDKRDGEVVMAGFGGSGVTTALCDTGVGIGTGCCDNGVVATAIAAIWVLRELDRWPCTQYYGAAQVYQAKPNRFHYTCTCK